MSEASGCCNASLASREDSSPSVGIDFPISGPVERDGACVGPLMASFPQEEEGRPDLIWVRLRRSDMVAGVEAQG